MTEQDKAKKQGPALANLCCTFIINIIMLIFFGIYAFDNPEKGTECYVGEVFGIGVQVSHFSSIFFGDY